MHADGEGLLKDGSRDGKGHEMGLGLSLDLGLGPRLAPGWALWGRAARLNPGAPTEISFQTYRIKVTCN